jgi:hypothetical protein
MSQKIITRVEKLEAATGINEPCEMCDLTAAQNERWTETLTRLGYRFRPVSESDILNSSCLWCERSVKINLENFNLSERVLFERSQAAHYAGTFCAPENKNLHNEVMAACERAGREKYGKLYDSEEAQALLAELEQATRDLANSLFDRGITTRHHYICQIADCKCNYPKSESEYQANERAMRKRAA